MCALHTTKTVPTLLEELQRAMRRLCAEVPHSTHTNNCFPEVWTVVWYLQQILEAMNYDPRSSTKLLELDNGKEEKQDNSGNQEECLQHTEAQAEGEDPAYALLRRINPNFGGGDGGNESSS